MAAAAAGVYDNGDIITVATTTAAGAGHLEAASYYDKDADEEGALIYIVVVIGLFAMSVLILVCHYINSASNDDQQNKTLSKIMKQLDEGFDPRKKMMGKLALSALNVANKCVPEDEALQRLTFV